jgi:hypothetical protein
MRKKIAATSTTIAHRASVLGNLDVRSVTCYAKYHSPTAEVNSLVLRFKRSMLMLRLSSLSREIQKLAPKLHCLRRFRFTKSGICSLFAQKGVYQNAHACPFQRIDLYCRFVRFGVVPHSGICHQQRAGAGRHRTSGRRAGAL